MSISQNFPDLTPSLNLNFAGSKKLDSRVTFTRGSTGTYMDDNGIIKTAGTNQPRFDHSYNGTSVESLGLLIEESRTNLLVQSNNFTTTWSTVGAVPVYSQNVISPTGVSNSGWTIDDQSTAFDASGFEQAISITPSTTTNYCFSIFAKQGTATYFDFYAFFVGNSTKGSYFRYNFSTDTISVSGSDGGGITPTIYGKIQYPNGWYRLYFVVNDANNGLNNSLLYRVYPGSRDAGLTGTTLFYGAQIEIGAFPTSYIPTGASQVTRSSDNATITGTNFSSWYNQNEGTLMYHGFARTSSLGAGVIGVMSDSTLANRPFQTQLEGAPTYVVCYHVSSGAIVAAASSLISAGDTFKSIFTAKTNDFAFCFNGGTVTTDTSGTYPPNGETFYIGRYLNIGYHMNGCMKSITYYPKRLTNTQLQNLTK